MRVLEKIEGLPTGVGRVEAQWGIFANGVLFEVVGHNRGQARNRMMSYANQDPTTDWDVAEL